MHKQTLQLDIEENNIYILDSKITWIINQVEFFFSTTERNKWNEIEIHGVW